MGSWGRMAALAMLASLALACASAPQTRRATDIKEIAGKWAGWATGFKSGRYHMKLIIAQDGRWRMLSEHPLWRGRPVFGTAAVEDDKYRFEAKELEEFSGTYTLQVGKTERWLIFMSDDGSTTAELRPDH